VIETENEFNYCDPEPLNYQEPGWGDYFEVSTCENTVTVTRMDSDSGWGQGLEISCCVTGDAIEDCDESEVPLDCEGQDYSGYESWIGDGLCDDGGWGMYFNCEEFDYDGGDCGGDCDDGCTDDEEAGYAAYGEPYGWYDFSCYSWELYGFCDMDEAGYCCATCNGCNEDTGTGTDCDSYLQTDCYFNGNEQCESEGWMESCDTMEELVGDFAMYAECMGSSSYDQFMASFEPVCSGENDDDAGWYMIDPSCDWVSLCGEPECGECNAGDADQSGTVDILDIVQIINGILYDESLFEADSCGCMLGDQDGSGTVDILDIVQLVNVILYG
jgi:hypothetical protein